MTILGPVHKGANHIPKAVSDRDSDPFLIWKPDFTHCERKALSNQAFETRLKREKRGVLDRDSRRKPDSEDIWTQSSFGTWFVRVHFGNARWSHAWVNQRGLGSRNKIYLTVRRSCSWLGRRLQCMWTHVVQIPNPIRKRIAIRNGFRNGIRSFVNRPIICSWTWLPLWNVIGIAGKMSI